MKLFYKIIVTKLNVYFKYIKNNTMKEYYVDKAILPHQKGKWAIFHNDAQIQGTVKNTREEAEAIAKGLNN